jgi:hypothetical protein
MVTRLELFKEFASIVPDDAIVVVSIGNNSGFWVQMTDREADLLHVTMGMCTPTALGLALGLPRRKVFALDADGNLLLNLGALGTVGSKSPSNLTIIVSDNGNYLGSHKDEPGMPTATSARLNLEGVARRKAIQGKDRNGAFEAGAPFHPRQDPGARQREAAENKTGAGSQGKQVQVGGLHREDGGSANHRQRARQLGLAGC